ncbi:hypothetical protein [Chitinophaga filiformis]|uniref:Uncharacterized protein n=1 Tax=Chitinophaga filiformis TaxID=104663 RepID=A0ABY4HY44_CHIFI|nr:hypothetical protein [Chitinophaga filiformis]UPK68310.1 hypothetical protein MYF79_25465 [Chitinophaga filiformis]
MEQHPLQYFKDLILRNKITKERLSFHTTTEYGKVTNRDYANGTIEYAEVHGSNEDDLVIENVTITFTTYLEGKINEELFNSLDRIDNRLLEIDDEKKQVLYLKTLYKTLNTLILYADELEHISKYTFVAGSLKSLKNELTEKYAVHDDATQQQHINLSSAQQTSYKLQWMGKSKVLITLFYDLYSNVENGGEPLIKATKDQVKNFLLNNFIEKDGQPLSASSIDTLLTPSKEDKRALKDDRIDTSKFKDKK